ILQGARALLRVIDRATMLPSEPARVLRLVRRLGRDVVTLESPRPEAETVAPAILAFADSVHIRRMGNAARAQEQAAPVPPRDSDPRPPATPASERASTELVTTYIVGGMPRSGTSMMMRALAAGGLEMFSDTDKDEHMANQWA